MAPVFDPPVLDVHQHYIPPGYRAALAAAGIDRPDGYPYVPQWSAESALELMDEQGVRATVLSISSPGVHFVPGHATRELARTVNEEGAETVRDHPDRFGLLASVPLPDVDAALEEVVYAADTLKADGFVLMTNYDGVYLGDERLDPLMAELDRREAVVALHPTSPQDVSTGLGRPRPMIEFMFDSTRAAVNLILSGTLLRYPRMRVIVPHLGATLSVLGDRLQDFVSGPHFGADQVDIFAALRGLHYDTSGASLPNALPALQRITSADHIMYGSDAPFMPKPAMAVKGRELLETNVLDDEEREGMFHSNGLRLFPRLAPCA